MKIKFDKTPEQLRNEFWNEDLANGGIIRYQYDEIKSVLEKEDMEWVLNQYKAIKKHAIEQTEFYSSFSVDNEFPVMNKTKLMENYEACTAKGGYLTPVHVTSTSGSTGTPFTVIQDYKKRKRVVAELKVFGELCNYPSHERMIFFRVLSEKLHRTPEQEEKENIYYIDASNLGREHLEKMRCAIIEKKPRIILGYSSTLVELAKYIFSVGTEQNQFGLTSVLCGGEGISETDRQMLENVFGCGVYRRYSNMEQGILGQDMANGSPYLLNYGSYYFECLKIDSDEPANEGEVGRIVITDLFNYAFPMIRYDTGDLGVVEKKPRNKFLKLKEVYGRIRDCVYTVEGTLLSPAKISVMMWGAKGVKQWQFIQESKNYYILKLNCIDKTDVNPILQKFKGLLGQEAIIDVKFVDEIPVISSNKRRAVICNYTKTK